MQLRALAFADRWILAAALCGALPLKAGPYATVPPSVFAVAGAGSGFGLTASRELSFTGGFNQFFVQTGIGPQSASATFALASGNTGSANAAAYFGYIQLGAHTVNPAAAPDDFAVGASDGGWIDNYLVTNAAFTGQPGILSLILHVEGELTVHGPNGFAGVQLEVNEPGFAPLFTQFTVGSEPAFPDGHLVISGDHVFNVSMVFGTPFELLIRAQAIDQARSEPHGPGNTGDIDFDHTIYWAGVSGITSGGNNVFGSTITGATGVNYNQSLNPAQTAVPEPYGGLLLAGTILLGYWRARRAT